VEQTRVRGLTPPIAGDIEVDDVPSVIPVMSGRRSIAFHTHCRGCFRRHRRPQRSGRPHAVACCRVFIHRDGAIRIDGTIFRDIDLTYLRGQTRIVPRNRLLFRGHREDNIRMDGRPRLRRCRRGSAPPPARRFSSRLPQRYETMLEEGAVNSPAGKAAALSIAARLSAPSAHHHTSTKHQRSIRKAKPSSSAISAIRQRPYYDVISHRLQTIRDADMIIVMDEGKVVDSGTPFGLAWRNFIYVTYGHSRSDGRYERQGKTLVAFGGRRRAR